MKLKVIDNNNVVDNDFAEWLLRYIQQKLLLKVNPSKLQNWSKYLTTSDSVSRLYSREYSAVDVVTQGIENLQVSFVSSNEFEIHINPRKFTLGFDRLPLETACKMIDFGNLQVRGTAIFSSTFEETIQELDILAMQYYRI